jgi:hypothetical protein
LTSIFEDEEKSVMRAVNEISTGGYMKEVSNLARIAFPILKLLAEK